MRLSLIQLSLVPHNCVIGLESGLVPVCQAFI